MTPVKPRLPASAAGPDSTTDASRRKWLAGTARAVAGAGLLSLVDPLVRAGAWAAGSDAPEQAEVKIGFIPLTDCASVVMASVLGIDKKYGVTITPSKEASWAAVRDKLLSGELAMAHVLYGLIYGVQMGIGGPRKDMAVLMNLNQNGQAITLSSKLSQAGARDGESLARLMASEKREYTFAQTFPTGTHAMWLYYWLAAYGIDPMKDAKVITVPPPQMVANMRVGNMDGFCVGEPWGARAILDKIGFTAVTTQAIWTDHPEKVLGTSADFVARNPNTARAVTAAILEAGKWIDASPENRRKTAETIAAKSYVNTDASGIVDRMLGQYDDGLGKRWSDAHPMRFSGDGAANFPYLSDGMWFLTQHKRWGLLKEHPDYLATARQVNRIDVYRQAAQAAGIAVPASEMRSSKLIDGVVWDGSNPAAYADAFKVKA
ncbi:CmpA/NrtA family ABC transporter substrate-binding protein [Achromobacter xylosoxidans]|uniref:CmpA/NrtA family ABC transporter substrate-binding protein n=1 Tax=Alcaligenes xylosoxydans xylosoxydans TaxID=85698 RepID=UPI0006C6F2D7|nr:CmpA/NrtA family ABC transporter substrate-binding protein [Achromobacter xylosoxidans]MCH4572774.1 ABC transporter substrate-binding protein [Achromobacter xylosoxidans]MDD7990964.1 CmpA/NrtA family ABC transporter substrate-binding protein [Achromobacter xylosoxidans]OFO68384.1 nitrate transporter [Achromobacter xylosoxidans]OMG88737.1 nitrate transporter [Achromobacter xylosoxidans]PNL95727.1 nitrate ABC transporter substrate-binding protein [Achromobacter xylosoxidans]